MSNIVEDKRKEIEKTLNEIFGQFCMPVPPEPQDLVERFCEHARRVYDEAFKEGIINVMPTVTGEWKEVRQMVELTVTWPVNTLEVRFTYENE